MTARSRWLHGALGALILLAGAMLYDVLISPPPHLPAVTVAPAPLGPLPAASAYVAPASSAFDELSSRPIFVAARRPPPPPKPPDPPPAEMPDPRPALSLIGIIIDPGETLAIVKQPNGEGTRSVTTGDMLAGWRVKEIRADQITLELNDRTEIYGLQ